MGERNSDLEWKGGKRDTNFDCQ